jgi:hypothetical protein
MLGGVVSVAPFLALIVFSVLHLQEAEQFVQLLERRRPV